MKHYKFYPEVSTPIGRKGLINSLNNSERVLYLDLDGNEITLLNVCGHGISNTAMELTKCITPIYYIDQDGKMLYKQGDYYAHIVGYCDEAFIKKSDYFFCVRSDCSDLNTFYVIKSNDGFIPEANAKIEHVFHIPNDSVYWKIPCYDFEPSNKMRRGYHSRDERVREIVSLTDNNDGTIMCELSLTDDKVSTRLPYGFILARDTNGKYMWIEPIIEQSI